MITHNHKEIFFFVKNYSLKTYEVYKATRSSPAVLNVTNFFFSILCDDEGHDTESSMLSSKENIGIDAWHEIRKKFTMLRFSKPHNLFHFPFSYRGA